MSDTIYSVSMPKSAAADEYSIHTMELRINLDMGTYWLIYESLRQYCEENNCCYYPKTQEYENSFYSAIIFDIKRIYGINKLKLCVYRQLNFLKNYLSIEINMRRFFGIEVYPFICIVPVKLLNQLWNRVRMMFENLGMSEELVNSCYIKRIDICTNIDLGTEEIASLYMKLMHKGRLPYSFKIQKIYSMSQKRYISDPRSFTISCDSSELSIYSKYEQMLTSNFQYKDEELQKAKGMVRIEYRLDRRKIQNLKRKHGVCSDVDFLEYINIVAKDEMERMLVLMYGTGDFYKLKEVQRRIRRSRHYESVKDDMENFCKIANGKYGVGGALQAFSGKRDMLKYFNILEISPICIPRRFPISKLYNPLYYIEHHNVNQRK